MDFTLQPSLQRFSCISIGIELWKEKEVRKTMTHLLGGEPIFWILIKNHHKQHDIPGNNKLNRFERKMDTDNVLSLLWEKVVLLPLPKILQKELHVVLEQMGYEICKTYKRNFCFPRKTDFNIYFCNLHWTPWGTIDEWKMKELILQKENDNLCKRNDVLGAKLGTKVECYYKILETTHLRIICRKMIFDSLPTMLLEKEVGDVFLKRLPEQSLLKFWVNCSRELFFVLISQLTTEQQKTFFQSNSNGILMEFLNLPRLKFFIECVELLKDFITDNYSFRTLFRTIAELGNCDFAEVFECHRLFEALWVVSPDSLKRKVFKVPADFGLLELILCKDARSINLMLNYASTEDEKMSIIKCIRDVLNSSETRQWLKLESRDDFLNELIVEKVYVDYLKRL